MPKTLIGNVRGKDGRGIAKIEKTATNGIIDTYTITYTDDTASTYELKNSDETAIQRQIVSSANIESGTTASKTYATGDPIVVQGLLRWATSSITSGQTIDDSNSKVEAVGDMIANLSRSQNVHVTEAPGVDLYNSDCKIKNGILSVKVGFTINDGFNFPADPGGGTYAPVLRMDYEGYEEADATKKADIVGAVDFVRDQQYLHFFFVDKTLLMWNPDRYKGEKCGLSFTTIL